MLKIACFCIAVTAAIPLWAQVQPSASGGSYELDDEHMMTPPPVSRSGYPVNAGAETRTNFLGGGLVFTAAGSDNLMLLGSGDKTPEETYAFLPTIELDRRTPRDGETLTYSTGFTLYQHYSQLNGVTQNAAGSYRLHLSPYAVLRLSDSYAQNYNGYNAGNPFSSGGVSGAPGSSGNPLIEPYANQLSNSSSANIEYQYAKNAMIGASGAYSFLQFSGNSFLPQLSNQDTSSASAFFSRRFGRSYAGLTYQFSKFITHPYGSYTLSNTVFGFYTHYFTRTISFSLLGGPERYTTWTETTPQTSAWTPAVQASVGWQIERANLAANYAHIVSGAGGLIGTFHSDTGGLSCEFMLTRAWSTSAHVEVADYSNVNTTPTLFAYYSGGNSISGGLDLERRLSESLSMEVGYQHLHQSYPGVTTASTLEDSDRGYMSIMYHFNRSLGR